METINTTTQQVDSTLSSYISVARFLMIIGLVVHHLFTLPNGGSFPRNGLLDYTYLLPEALNALVHMAFMAAVPMLSIISGYLLFTGHHRSYGAVLRKKFWSIALPAWLWSGIWLLLAFGLYWVGHERGMFEWANYHFDQFNILVLLNGVVGIDDLPFAFQFWFIHDLLLTFLLFPLIRWLLDQWGIGFVAVLFLFWLTGIDVPVFFSLNIPLFFIIGAYLALSPHLTLYTLFHNHRRLAWCTAGVFVVLLVLRAWTFLLFDQTEHAVVVHWLRSETCLSILRVLGVLFFAQFIIGLATYCRGVFTWLDRLAQYSFFIFAVHFPLIEMVKVVAGRLPGQNSAVGVLLAWLLIPVLVVSACILFAWLFNRVWPWLFAVLNGRRPLLKH